MKYLAGLALALAASVASAADSRHWGESDQESHFVSVAELIGRAEFFAGQPVSAVGIVQFRDGAQPVMRLYATERDLKDSIPAAVALSRIPEELALSDADMQVLNGSTVLIEVPSSWSRARNSNRASLGPRYVWVIVEFPVRSRISSGSARGLRGERT